MVKVNKMIIVILSVITVIAILALVARRFICALPTYYEKEIEALIAVFRPLD
jgi:uncharacterized membrane protein